MKLVNLFAGPGAGKSTTAALAFGKLKQLGYNCELVTEFAKDLTWEGRIDTAHQVQILGEQYQRIWRLHRQVDVVITDSPILLSGVYNQGRLRNLDALVRELHYSFDSLNYFLTRCKPYHRGGRNQTEEGAKDIDQRVLDYLGFMDVLYTSIKGDETAPARIVRDLR